MPRLCLINAMRGPVPPNGYCYVDPVDGFVAHGFDYTDWVNQEEKHLSVNGREVPPDLNLQMEEQLCKVLPPGWGRYEDPQRPRPSHALEWDEIKGGLSTFAKWIAGGCKFVDKEEADRRAAICSRCYLNMKIGGCASCQKAVAHG